MKKRFNEFLWELDVFFKKFEKGSISPYEAFYEKHFPSGHKPKETFEEKWKYSFAAFYFESGYMQCMLDLCEEEKHNRELKKIAKKEKKGG